MAGCDSALTSSHFLCLFHVKFFMLLKQLDDKDIMVFCLVWLMLTRRSYRYRVPRHHGMVLNQAERQQ
jgi:hypothetical protein